LGTRNPSTNGGLRRRVISVGVLALIAISVEMAAPSVRVGSLGTRTNISCGGAGDLASFTAMVRGAVGASIGVVLFAAFAVRCLLEGDYRDAVEAAVPALLLLGLAVFFTRRVRVVSSRH
jgi:hypothetical protein